MSVTKNELLDMLGKSISADLAAEGTPTPQKEPVFSEDFEQSMNEFFAKGSSAKKKNKVRPKRWLIIAIAAVVALTATACAVPQVRESIAGFFVQIFGSHVDYTDPAVTKTSIEEEYCLVPVPDGFEISFQRVSIDTIVTHYSDADGNTIVLKQIAGTSVIETVDSEHGAFSEVTIDGVPVRVYKTYNATHASWVADGYYFSLSYTSPIDIELFEEWIASVGKL